MRWHWRRVVVLSALTAFAACASEAPVWDLDDLVVRDSTYYLPSTMEPFTGRVARSFEDDPEQLQLEGELLEGTWHGELVVYHESGRVRYMGAFHQGERCGPWTENADDVELETPYQQLIREIETLGMYPPCPTDR